MHTPEKLDWEECIRLFLKTVMGNAIPVFWLFILQDNLSIQFDGFWFWAIYLFFSILVVIGMWLTNRTTPHLDSDGYISTPVLGFLAAIYQLIVFVIVFMIYHLW